MILIKGAGDIASGIALRLHNAGFTVVMTDLSEPTAIRRTVSFCSAIKLGMATIENVEAKHARQLSEVPDILAHNQIPVLADPNSECLKALSPMAVIDAILAKKNIATKISMAPIVLAVGPGFTAGKDCHAIIESKRGHSMGRVIYDGSAIPNTGRPGIIGGYSDERLLRAPCTGRFKAEKNIGDIVRKGDIVCWVDDVPVTTKIDGVVRGILFHGLQTYENMKIGDVDPRGIIQDCLTVSDKALAIAGGALEALLHLGYNQ